MNPTPTLDRDLDRLRELAQADDLLAEAVSLLAAAPLSTADPFARPPDAMLAVARTLSERRDAARTRALEERSLTTGQVVELIDDLANRGAVQARRRRGRLLGITARQETLHPAWQFSFDRRETHAGLTEVLAALFEHASTPEAADALAVVPQPDADGNSIADLLAAGRVEDAVALAHLAGDQS